jgi:hypothetical protein
VVDYSNETKNIQMKQSFRICIALAVIALAFTAGYLEAKREQSAMEAARSIEVVRQLPSDHRKYSCAAYIGKLEGSKHEAALVWFQPFYDGNHPMTEKDYDVCMEF